jgi:lysophospholipase L1-like esterase
MGKYKTFGSRFDRVHRNDLNANFAAVEADINAQKNRVDELITGTPQPSEVVDARGGFPVLSGRLNDLSSSLAQKAAQSDLEATNSNVTLKADRTYVDTNLSVLDTKINSQASGSPKGTYATLTALQTAFPTGNTNIYVVTADGKWYYWNGSAWTAGGTYQSAGIADGSISPLKTSFLITGKNLFNKNTVNLGYYVYEANGTLAASASYNASDYIPVSPSTNYTFISPTGGTRIAYYDANKTFISGVVGPTMPITTPSNARYVRFSFSTTLTIGTQQFELGDIATPYEAYKQMISLDNFNLDNIKIKEISLADDSVTDTKIKSKAVSLSKLSDDVVNILTKYNALTVTKLSGYRHIDRNEINANEAYNYAIVDCIAGDLFKITASISGTATALIVFTNSNGDKVSHLEAGTASVVSYTDYEFVVPSGATKIYFTFLVANAFSVSKKSLVDLSTISKPYDNTKWVCVGDSLTAENAMTTKRYFDYIAEELGFNVVNMGVSGTGYKKQEETTNAFYQRISNVPTDADVVTIFGSGNDESLPLGTVTDTGTGTVCGCINKTLDNYYVKLPTTPIGLITPTPWEYRPPTNVGNTMDLIANAIIDIGKRRSVPVLDLYHSSGLRPWDATFKTLAYSKDGGGGVHPDEKGHEIIASKIREFVKSLI